MSVLINFLRKHLQDRAVLYSLLSRVSSMGLGPLVILFVGSHLKPEEQGVYYVFGSLLQLRILVDLGFSQSAQQILAHTFGGLAFSRAGGVMGPEIYVKPFLDNAAFVCRTFLKFGLASLPIVGLSGYIYLKLTLSSQDIEWAGPWWLMILSVGFGVASLGILSVADSANLLGITNKWRFISDTLAILAFVGVLGLGGGLWASAIYSWARTLLLFLPLSMELGLKLFSQVAGANPRAVNYKKDVAPLQVRNMIVWSMGVLYLYCYNPMTLAFCGPVAAGVVGMSLQVSNIAQGMALIWVSAKVPLMGNLAGSGLTSELEELHRQSIWISASCWILCSAGVLGGSWVAAKLFPTFGSRYGSPTTLAILLMGAGGYGWYYVRSAYIRAHRVEPFALMAMVQAGTTLLLLTLFLERFKEMAAAVTYALTMIGGALYVEYKYRQFRAQKLPATSLHTTA